MDSSAAPRQPISSGRGGITTRLPVRAATARATASFSATPPFRLRLAYERSEAAGPLFEEARLRVRALASQAGLEAVFSVVAIDVFGVEAVEEIEVLDERPDAGAGRSAPALEPMDDLSRLQRLSTRLNAAPDLTRLLSSALEELDRLFGFAHAMVLVPEDGGRSLVAIEGRGYPTTGAGAEVALGQGVIGAAAIGRRVLRTSGMTDLIYARAVRSRVEHGPGASALRPEIPLPGLPDAQSQLGIPLLVGDRLVGVLAVESRNRSALDRWQQTVLEIIGNQLAVRLDVLARAEAGGELDEPRGAAAPARIHPRAERARRRFCLYRNDDCVFLDDEYLVRNVPAKILWRLLTAHQREGRTRFSNRELRLDESLGLPALRDNLESRLILLRHRLEEKCRDVAIVPVRRGAFSLEVRCELELLERESA